MAGDFDLISAAERQRALDVVQRRADWGGMSQDELLSFTTRVHAAQTHAGLESVLLELPPERPWKMPETTPPDLPALPWWQRPVTVVTAAAIVGVGIFVAAVVGLAAASDDGRQAGGRPIIELPPAEIPRTTTTRVPVTTAPPTTVRPIAPPTTVAAAMLRVGEDIQPGRYMSATTVCYWERRSGVDPGLDDVIVNGGTSFHTVVDIAPSDVAFFSDYSCIWKPYAAPATAATTFEDGDWLVGSDIQAGTYERTDPQGFDDFCGWERASGFRHDYDEIIAYGYPTGPETVRLAAGERFTTEACGPWTKVG